MRNVMTVKLVGVGASAAVLLGGWARAGQPPAAATSPSGGNRLATLPSRAGEHVARIKALGDNEWLILGTPSADPKWGVARGRSWGGRALTYAPGLGGAFFSGEGRHAYVDPKGYYLSDLWFYDANAHRWICLYPGVHAKTVKLRLDEHGFEVNERGEHTPIAFLGHAYGSTTYDSDLRKYVVIYANICYVNAVIKQRQEWLGVPREKWGRIYSIGRLNARAKHPLFWDVAAGRWERRFVEAPGGFDRSREDGVAQYIPSLKKTLFAIRDQVWFYDYRTNTWTGSAKTGCPVKGYENGCYDPKRKRLYIARQKDFAYYDIPAERWTLVRAEGQPETFYSSNGVCLTYDTAADVVLYHYRKPHGTIAAYEPEANRWVRPAKRTFPAEKIRGLRYMLLNSFYHPELNVHFYYLAGDSRNKPATMLAYRYKNP